MRGSRFVCRHCGVAVHLVGPFDTWKHFANRYVRSCGAPLDQSAIIERKVFYDQTTNSAA